MRALIIVLSLLVSTSSSMRAQTFSQVPYIFANGSKYNPSQVMADFQSITNSGNSVSTAINSAILTHTPEPSGIMLWFNLASCPSGWTTKAGYGNVFVRGLDLGRGVDTTGTVVGGAELGVIQSHTHSVNGFITGGTTTTVFAPAGAQNTGYYTGMTSFSNPFTGGASGTLAAEVRPDNVSLLLCIKN